MRRNCCHVSLSFLMKLLNFLQAFVGISILLYSVWMLNRRNHQTFPPVAPSPAPTLSSSPSHVNPLNLAIDAVSDFDNALHFGLYSFQHPSPWFIYAFMGVGILVCCITLLGCIAAEAFNGSCLCFYAVLKTIFLLLEVALVVFLAIDHRWEKDIPFDPTGELDRFRSFVADNVDICKWVGLIVVTIQALSLLLAIILRATISTLRTHLDDEEEYDVGRKTQEPLLNSQALQSSGSHSDIWSSRMREKYGLNSGHKYNLPDQNASASMKRQ